VQINLRVNIEFPRLLLQITKRRAIVLFENGFL